MKGIPHGRYTKEFREEVELHWGRFTVKSAPGEGSKFGIHCR